MARLAPLSETPDVGASSTPTTPMSQHDPTPESTDSIFRRTLVRVVILQIVALALLALLQLRYNI